MEELEIKTLKAIPHAYTLGFISSAPVVRTTDEEKPENALDDSQNDTYAYFKTDNSNFFFDEAFTDFDFSSLPRNFDIVSMTVCIKEAGGPDYSCPTRKLSIYSGNTRLYEFTLHEITQSGAAPVRNTFTLTDFKREWLKDFKMVHEWERQQGYGTGCDVYGMDVTMEYIPRKIQNMIQVDTPVETAMIGNTEIVAIYSGDVQIYG